MFETTKTKIKELSDKMLSKIFGGEPRCREQIPRKPGKNKGSV